ncbi:MAG: terminase TerL endonuclease subunit [Acetobacterales bacterium]
MAEASSEPEPHPVTDYAQRVVAGEIPAGLYVRQACQRHLDDLESCHARGLWFDEVAAHRAIGWFGFFRHGKGPAANLPIELALWQCFIVGSVFGWKRADGTRRFRVVYIEIPRKNGKTTLAAGLGLYMLVADGEFGAEVYSAATKKDQAKYLLDIAKSMVRRGPASLRRRLDLLQSAIVFPKTESSFIALGSNENTLDGLNPHAALIDELHKHKSRAVYELMETAVGARSQPLLIAITTAGDDPASVCWEQHDYVVQMLGGVLPNDDSTFGYVASIDPPRYDEAGEVIDPGDDWADPAAWAKANPNLGIGLEAEKLEELALRAVAQASRQPGFKRYHLNVWGENANAAIPLSVWDACPADLDDELLAGRECFGGLDLSSRIDTTAFALMFPPDPGELLWHLLVRFYLPEARLLEATRRDRVPYATWVEQGWIRTTPGEIVDQDFILDDIEELAGRYRLREIGFDSWNATQMAIDLSDAGFDVTEVRQGAKSLSSPCKDMEALLLARRLNHGGNPVLRKQASSLVWKRDTNDNIQPDKAKSPRRIDGMVAAIMALARATGEQGGTEIEYRQGDMFR